jgi:cell wall-associated NlpC family hydrolase
VSAPLNQLTAGDFLLEAADTQTGLPYDYGAEDPGVAFDCSGLTQWSALEAEIVLPRTTEEQYKLYMLRKGVASKPGDLLFIPGDPIDANPGHVMIFVAPGVAHGVVFEAEMTGTKIGRFEYDTESYEFRTRPALAHPLPTTIARAGLVRVNLAGQDEAVHNGWRLRYWNGVTFATEPPSPLRTTSVYASARYKKRR